MSIFRENNIVWISHENMPDTCKTENDIYKLLYQIDDESAKVLGAGDREIIVYTSAMKHIDEVLCCPKCAETINVWQPKWYNENTNSVNNNNSGMEGLSDYCGWCKNTVKLITLKEYLESVSELSSCCQAPIRPLDCELCKTEKDHECIEICTNCGAEC